MEHLHTAPADLYNFVFGGQSDFTSRSGESGAADLYVSKSVGATRIRRKKPECLLSIVGVPALRAHVGIDVHLVAADFGQALNSFGIPVPSGCRNLSPIYFHKRGHGSEVSGDWNCVILKPESVELK